MITNLKIDEERKRLYYQQGYWTEETLYDVWNRQARACADREYVVDDRGNRYTYAYVDDAAARLASWLKDVGVEEGDVVSFQMPVWAEFCIVYVACLKAGAVMHPLSRAFNERDLRYVLNQVKSAAFICPAFSRGCRFDAQIESVEADVPSLKGVAVFDRDRSAISTFPSSSASWKATSRSKRSLSARQPTTPPSSSLRRVRRATRKPSFSRTTTCCSRNERSPKSWSSRPTMSCSCLRRSITPPASTTACFPPCCWEEKPYCKKNSTPKARSTS